MAESDIDVLLTTKQQIAAAKKLMTDRESMQQCDRSELYCRLRVGQLVPKETGGRGKLSSADDSLSATQRYEWRLMAEYEPISRSLIDKVKPYRQIIDELKRRKRRVNPPKITDKTVAQDVWLPSAPVAVADLADKIPAHLKPLDAIITDPPYHLETIHCWEDLTDFASETLKPGGILVAYSGQMFLPETMEALRTRLDYVWMGAVIHNGPFFQLREHKIQVGWKPLLIFSNGKPAIENWWMDTLTMGRVEKDYHGWQQAEAEAAYLIEQFTVEGELVCDPMVGGGTTAAAAIKSRRRFVGSDLDPDALHATRERLNAR